MTQFGTRPRLPAPEKPPRKPVSEFALGLQMQIRARKDGHVASLPNNLGFNSAEVKSASIKQQNIDLCAEICAEAGPDGMTIAEIVAALEARGKPLAYATVFDYLKKAKRQRKADFHRARRPGVSNRWYATTGGQ